MDDLDTVLARAHKVMPNIPAKGWFIFAAYDEQALRWLLKEAEKGRKATDANILPETTSVSALLNWSKTPWSVDFWANLNTLIRRNT